MLLMIAGIDFPSPAAHTRAREVVGAAESDPHRKSSDLLLMSKPFWAYPRIESEKRKDRRVNGLRRSTSV
jgi:hypothetical protein